MAVNPKEIMDKEAMLEAAVSKVNKQFGPGAVWMIGETDIPRIESVSTNAITLDQALGIGGIPRGRITEIYGPESSGKTTLALHVAANVQRSGGTVAIIDAEHALDLGYAKRIGVDVSQLLVSQPDTGEQALEIAETLVRGGVACVIVDSVAMLIPESELRGEMGDFQVGAQARLMSKALRKLTAPVSDAGCVFIMINQIRANIGGYGNPEVTPGGRALRFAASVRIDLRKKETIRDGEQNVGIKVLAKIVKNKLAPPATQAEFDVYFGVGISYLASLIEAGQISGVIRRSGSWLFHGDKQLGQGSARAIEALRNNSALADQIRNEIMNED